MIGISLSFEKLIYTDDEELKPEVLLPKFKAAGVGSIEMRTVRRYSSPEDVCRVANMLWDFGFNITVHSECKSVETAVSDVFAPLSEMLKNMRQKCLTLTVHDVPGDNAEMLISLSDYAYENGYNLKIALENSRKMPSGELGNDLPIVLDAVKRANRENVGICFDMGHYAWYIANYTDEPRLLPPDEFLARIFHTHIHKYTEGYTHFPIDTLCEPLVLYLDAINSGYKGIHNLELEPTRYIHRCTATEGYLVSIDALRRYGIKC